MFFEIAFASTAGSSFARPTSRFLLTTAIICSTFLVGCQRDAPDVSQDVSQQETGEEKILDRSVRLEQIIADFQKEKKAFNDWYEKATLEERQTEYESKTPNADIYSNQLIALSDEVPNSPLAFKALQWSAAYSVAANARAETFKRILKSHRDNPAVADLVPIIAFDISKEAESLLRGFAQRSADRNVKAVATYALAAYLQAVPSFKKDLEKPHLEKSRDYLKAFEVDSDEIKELYTLICEKFADIDSAEYGNLGKQSESALFELTRLRVGEPVPDVIGTDLSGNEITLRSFRGKVVVVSFWATWCRACLEMVPQERELAEKLANVPFQLIGINGDGDTETAQATAKKHEITWPQFFDGSNGGGPIAKQWNVVKWPTIYVIDAKGIIRFSDIPARELDAAVEELLSEMGHEVTL